jgi:hypothetical protein
MNKEIPEGGRYVKCARCGNQWRLVPEGYVEQTIEPDTVEDNPVAPQRPFSFEDSREPITAHEPDLPAGPPEAAGFASWQTRREHFAGAISTLSEPQAMNYGDRAAETEDEPDGRHGWHDFDAERSGEPSSHYKPDADPAVSGSLARSAEPPADDDEDEDSASEDAGPDESGADWAARMNRPWREIVEASRMSAEAEEEDTEAAIRNALKAALEHPVEDGARMGLFQEQLRDQHEDPPRSDVGWGPFVPRDTQPHPAVGEAHGGNDEEDVAEAEEADHPPFTIPGHQPVSYPDQEDEAPFKLTGHSARRPVYEAEASEASEASEGEDDDEAASLSAGFRHDIEDAFRAAPLPKKSFEAGQRRHDESLTDFDRLYDEQATGGQIGPEFYDEDSTAALQAELESTDLAAYESRRGGGGLAVAAAWAVFFSMISGVALAVVTLRSEIMATLPGTTSLYRAIGFDVAESGIDFADVSYRWTVAQGKPMIEVKGQVVNITDRRLTVPRVLINVRDADNSDAVKVTASVPTETLAPRESASFTLEFVSPPKNISQIELEFDRNR